MQLVEAAEAKAYYGLASNYTALAALAETLMAKESLTGEELSELLEAQGEWGRQQHSRRGMAQQACVWPLNLLVVPSSYRLAFPTLPVSPHLPRYSCLLLPPWLCRCEAV